MSLLILLVALAIVFIVLVALGLGVRRLFTRKDSRSGYFEKSHHRSDKPKTNKTRNIYTFK